LKELVHKTNEDTHVQLKVDLADTIGPLQIRLSRLEKKLQKMERFHSITSNFLAQMLDEITKDTNTPDETSDVPIRDVPIGDVVTLVPSREGVTRNVTTVDIPTPDAQTSDVVTRNVPTAEAPTRDVHRNVSSRDAPARNVSIRDAPYRYVPPTSCDASTRLQGS
jgi:hypothetical protein